MPSPHLDTDLKRDLFKLGVVFSVVLAVGTVFFITPPLSGPTLLSIVVTMVLTPFVARLERAGLNRIIAILLLFIASGALLTLFGVWIAASIQNEWQTLLDRVPRYFDLAVEHTRELERRINHELPFLTRLDFADNLLKYGSEAGNWFVQNSASLAGGIFSWIFLVPILTFIFLKDGPLFRKRFFELVPNRFFEEMFMVIYRITEGLSAYIRAKFVEASLVMLMSTIGLIIVGAPYALVLGLWAGLTNIVPYAGPVIGALPGILIVAMDPSFSDIILPVTLVYLITNAIDMIYLFPVLVAQLVNLHPLILITVVIVGQQLYGLVGMLISIPLATAIKVVLTELHVLVYQSHRLLRQRGDAAKVSESPPQSRFNDYEKY